MRIRQSHPNFQIIFNLVCFERSNDDPANHNSDQIPTVNRMEADFQSMAYHVNGGWNRTISMPHVELWFLIHSLNVQNLEVN